jgi:hypothetical protein
MMANQPASCSIVLLFHSDRRLGMIPSRSRFLALLAAVALLLTAFAAYAPKPASAAGLISIRIHTCPNDYAGASASIYDLAANCHTPGAGLKVTLSKNQTFIATMTGDNNGWLNFANFEATNEAELTEAAPLGFYNRAFCALYMDNDSGAKSYYEYQDPVLQVIRPGQNFDCDFFNVIYVPVSPTTIYVNKHVCPQGFDVAGATMYDLAANCNGAVPDGSFTLKDNGGQPITSALQNGLVSWQQVALGDFTITETPMPGYNGARVFCNTKNTSGDESGFAELPVSNYSVTGTTKSGFDTFCDWFNIAEPAGAPTEEPLNGSPTEQPVEQPTEEPTSPPIGNASGGSTPVPTTTAPKARLIVFVQTCPAGYNVFSASANPQHDCTESAADVPFTLAGAAGSPVKHTVNASGWVDFSNLDAGRYQLTESPPDGVTSAFIDHCVSDQRSFGGYPFTPFARVGSSSTIGLTLLAGEKLACNWYDVPSKNAGGAATPTGGAEVSIALFACPGQSVILSQCQPGESGVEFTLTASGGGQPETLTTDASGVAAGEVPPGAYTLAESGGAWCLADSTAFDQQGNLTVADQPVAVKVYDCGT